MDRNDGATIVLAIVSLTVLAVVAASLPIAPSSPDGPRDDADTPDPNSAGNEGSEPMGGAIPLPLVQVVFLGALGVVGSLAAVVGYYTLSRPANGGPVAPTEPPLDERETADGQLEDVAAAAGRAANRIGRAESFENEIHRAWWEMTSAMSVPDPDTKTPGEFAERAIRAGMDERDVRDLTALFEDVRYGDGEPTPDEVDRAVALLERIEASHGGDRS